MPFLDETGVKRFWQNAKAFFSHGIKASTTDTAVNVILTAKKTTTDTSGKETESDIDLASGSIPSATTTSAGVMSAADKQKLNGIASGATSNKGTITGISTSAPLSGSGTSGSVSISHSASGVTAGTYGTTATTSLTPGFGQTFSVPGISVNSTGHTTAAGSHTVTIPGTIATPKTDSSTGSAGLLSAADKAKLDGIADGANKNTVTGVKGGSESTYRTGQVNITKSNIGLGNVDNTSDANKPISTATQSALNKKADSATTLAGYGITDGMTASAIQTAINTAVLGITPENIGAAPAGNYAGAASPGGAAISAAKLASPVTIDGVPFDGSSSISRLGGCDTAAETADKVVTLPADGSPRFELLPGSIIVVGFEYENKADNPTLNVNGTGAKPIYINGDPMTASTGWGFGAVVIFLYIEEGYLVVTSCSPISSKTIDAIFD